MKASPMPHALAMRSSAGLRSSIRHHSLWQHLLRNATASTLAVIATFLSYATHSQSAIADSNHHHPNVVLVMADDQGWGEVGYPLRLSPTGEQTHQGAYDMPQLSEMASAGMTFHRFYSGSPVCSPTRATFQTGRNHLRTDLPGLGSGHLRNGELTIAELAQTQGYVTGHFGKWHIGSLDRTLFELDGPRGGYSRTNQFSQHSAPWHSGYDRCFAIENCLATYDHYLHGYVREGEFARFWFGPGNPIYRRSDPQYEGDPDQPHTDPRTRGDLSTAIMGEAIDFIEASAEAGEPFFATVWFSAPHSPITHPGETLREQYTGALSDIDAQVGRLRNRLAELHLTENTLVVFTSDNGPHLRGGNKTNPGSTGGLRGDKGEVWEGGIRVPAIFEWPGHIAEGSSTDTPGGVVDFLPTLLDLWGMAMPDARPLDGQSLCPIWQGAPQREVSMKWWYQPGRQAVITDAQGRYKLITMHGRNTQTDYLFDLLADPREQDNLAGDPLYAEVVSQLRTERTAWLESANASRRGTDYHSRVTSLTGATLLDIQTGEGNPWNYTQGSTQTPNSTPTLYVERQHMTLREPLQVSAANSADQQALPSGTLVNSFLLHFDPGTEAATSEISITFDDVILGLLSSTEQLVASDHLAFASPDFEESATRGLEAEETEWTLSEDRRTLSLRLHATATNLDQLRIVTQSHMQSGE